MATNTYDFLMRVMEDNWTHARQAEEKRATLAHLNLVLAAAIQMVLVFVGFHPSVLPVTLWLFLSGMYGIIASIKLYERSQFHLLRARKLRTRLSEMLPESQVDTLQQCAEEEHRKHYDLWMKLRLNTIWLCLHAVISLLGAAYSVLCLLR